MLIPRAKIKEFCRENSIAGIVGFFAHLSKHFQNFKSFLGRAGISTPNPPVSVLFHGSQTHLDNLDPSISTGEGNLNYEKSLVYATDNPNYAVFLAVIDLAEGSNASVLVEDNKTLLSIDIGFVNGHSQIKDGYVHVVDGTQFKLNDNDEYVSQQPARILFSVKVKPSDLTEKIYLKID
ncbi:MAG: hypothetical protein A3C06_03005 [Candidatus Taylorbacteria bacterium RIFCSPHIGHO2_02_FULL_46_13]|uniref:Uncharacterized protein n=1 Tax=Candidatus Taylorbacteria bacterium RIFCSPHIGHO2_02_FULL_46_13 TaxID=1802312 RepID=A0A1G2MRK0_9BACT|nr:MAG: hypothetical protein A3C06_03005 [Candidatus Taylorbacteria bacterium RIFCSPHIGHO2_02_FULL_46_13]